MGPRLLSRGNQSQRPLFVQNIDRFNGATAFEPWERIKDSHGSLEKMGFNGATAFEPWELACGRFVQAMLPQCFNGATAFEPWEQTLGARRHFLPLSFNGTTACEPGEHIY